MRHDIYGAFQRQQARIALEAMERPHWFKGISIPQYPLPPEDRAALRALKEDGMTKAIDSVCKDFAQ